MKKLFCRFIYIYILLFFIETGFAQFSTKIIYVSPNGDDNASGALTTPKQTLSGALAAISDNGYIYDVARDYKSLYDIVTK
mgnify:CR=1 FL=1